MSKIAYKKGFNMPLKGGRFLKSQNHYFESEGVCSNAYSWLITFKHRFISVMMHIGGNTAIFSQIDPLKEAIPIPQKLAKFQNTVKQVGRGLF